MAVYKSKWKGAEIDAHLDTVDTLSTSVSSLQTQNTTQNTDISNLKTQANTSTNDITSIKSRLTTLEDVSTFVSTYTGEEINEYLAYIDTLKSYDSEPIGIRIDTSSSSPIVEHCDQNGVVFSPSESFFELHSLWQFKRCVRNRTTGLFTYGTNNRGDGLETDGTSGDVFVKVPMGGIKWWYNAPYLYIIVCPYHNMPQGFSICPAAYQRGGTPVEYMYVGAFEASVRKLSGTRTLQSIAGVQPMTGGGAFKYVSFTAGTSAFVAGATVTGATSSTTAIISEVLVSSGDLTEGTGVGTVYLHQILASDGTTAGTFTNGENLTISGTTAAVIGSDIASLSFSMTNAEVYGNNLSVGCGICDIHIYDWITLLMLIEFGTFNIQQAFARGIVDYVGTSTYMGRLTEADTSYSDNIHSYMSLNGTGVGTGVAGKTPFWYRGLENFPYGNITEMAIGFNADGTTGTYHIINRTGVATSTIEPILSAGNYEVGPTTVQINTTEVPFTGAYISDIKKDNVSVLSFIPDASNGTSSTYRCDFYTPPISANSVLLVGGNWSKVSMAGPFYKSMTALSTDSTITTGCRLICRPQ